MLIIVRVCRFAALVALAPYGLVLAAEPAGPAFAQCAVCHSAEKGEAHGVGPNLFGVVDKEIASTPGFIFSRALKKRGGTWTEAELHRWLENPQTYAPGTKMAYGGLKTEAARQAVIDYLKTLR